MTMREMEKLLLTHLQESGEIRTDLAWLKRSYWAVVGVAITQLVVTLWR